MPNTAILIGNWEYQSLPALPCCLQDLLAMEELLQATDKYANIARIENANADDLKSQIREIVSKQQTKEELFFYYTGHGCQQEHEFYYCATEFNSKRPNQTGLSTNDLHALLRQANAALVVKVIDACNSGTLLVKSDSSFQYNQKEGINDLIQISACRETQNALPGEPISIFTETFRSAALRKTEGAVYYMDIVSVLRDEYLKNDEQTPFFVTQGTGRDQFVSDARRLDSLRSRVDPHTAQSQQLEGEDEQAPEVLPSLQELLRISEANAASPQVIEGFVSGLFDGLIEDISGEDFSDFFDLNIQEHADFSEVTTEAFIVRVVSRQDRVDELVTARVKKKRIANPLERLRTSFLTGILGDDETIREIYDLELNCDMKRAQIKIEFVPKFRSLKKLVVVVTCAPSLQYCYIFEMGTQHGLTNFDEFAVDGDEVTRRWYKLAWKEDSRGVAEKISSKLREVVRAHLEDTQRILANMDE